MFVAVVYKYHPDTDPKSHKDHGGWESFLGDTKEAAIEAAILASQRWETQPNPMGKYYGPYRILVGEITEEAKRVNYNLEKYDADAGLPW